MPQAPITTVQHWTLGEARMNAMYFLEKSTPFRRYVASLASCFRAETPTLSNINKSQSKCTYFYIISGGNGHVILLFFIGCYFVLLVEM